MNDDPSRYALWKDRWDRHQTGFHEGTPNAFLVAHLARLAPKPSRILVPLAGKSEDLFYLVDQGHEVVGVEFVENAVAELFARRGLDASKLKTKVGAHDAFVSGKLTMIRGDMLTMTPADLGRFDAVYDRAALIAFIPAARPSYVAVCSALLGAGGRSLVITLAYDQSKADGPPWSVDEATLRALFAGREIERLEAQPTPVHPRFASAGVTAFEESAYLVRAETPK